MEVEIVIESGGVLDYVVYGKLIFIRGCLFIYEVIEILFIWFVFMYKVEFKSNFYVEVKVIIGKLSELILFLIFNWCIFYFFVII